MKAILPVGYGSKIYYWNDKEELYNGASGEN